MTAGPVLAPRRTAWDVVLGLLLVVGAFVVLGDVIIATAVSVLLIGWIALISGVVLIIGALRRVRTGGFWSAAFGGAVLTVFGLFVLRNPLIGAVTLTFMAGALFLTSGLARIVAAFGAQRYRVLLIVSGLISAGLGVWVLFINPVAATVKLLGVLLAIQILTEGLTLITIGRLRPVPEVAAEI